jgi:quaternary ammonium compound-resistance protein SugE
MAMAWLVRIVAGVFETGWAVGLKYSEGFTRFWPSVWTVVCLVISMLLLGWSVRTLPLGTAYAVWTGIGAVGAVLVGILVFREPATAARLVCLGLIVSGIVGLKIFSGPSA